MSTLLAPALVALGAALGGMTRYVAGLALDGRWPTGTLLVNVGASGLLGVVLAVAPSGPAWALLATGFCGALSTFSAFAVQAVGLPRREGSAYVAATVAGSLGLCAAGWWLGSLLA